MLPLVLAQLDWLPLMQLQQARPATPASTAPDLRPGKCRERSAEDIQRDYDAVPGYSKEPAGPPSAPPAPPGKLLSPVLCVSATAYADAPPAIEPNAALMTLRALLLQPSPPMSMRS